MQRLHVDDLAGYVMSREPWIHLNLPAIADSAQRIQIGDGRVSFSARQETFFTKRANHETFSNSSRALSVASTSVLNFSSARFRSKAKSSSGVGFNFSMLARRECPMIASYKVGTRHLNRKNSTTTPSARAGWCRGITTTFLMFYAKSWTTPI